MESRAIKDAQLSASSQWGGRVLHTPSQGRLNFRSYSNKAGAWCPRKNDPNPWLQVDLGSYTTVTRVATQGRNGWGNWWVTKYRLLYSDNGITFHYYKDPSDNSAKIFDGNKDKDTVVYNRINPPITTRFIRLQPVQWNNEMAIRMELYGCPGCIAPLGMESRTILDAQISASSQMNGNHSASQARLYLQADGSKFGGWSALTNDVNQWLQVDFGSYTTVTRIATQGENGYNNWVTKYKLKYSDDGTTFQFYKDVGGTSPKVFIGNTDSETVVYNKLSLSIRTRFIRILPIQWNRQIAMRIEVYGCPGCIAPAGMESGAISDFQISASSQKTDSFAASRARLNVKVTGIKQGGWSPLKDDLNQWLQVDLSSYTTVTRLATQGRDGSDEWVTKFKLQYSVDGLIYHFYKGRGESSSTIFDGNQDSNTIVYNKLNSPSTVRLVRLLPMEWHNHICLRMEIYGCPGCIAPLGMENGAISDAQISASSQWDNNHGPRRARLNGKRSAGNGVGAWCAITNDIYQWLQVDLRKYTTVTRIATQGRSDWNQWVTKYRLQYSEDGVNFHFYKALGQDSAMLFDGNKDRNTIVYQTLSQPKRARYVRILPEAWYGHISMRMELYGCSACEAPLGMESEAITDSQVSASSQLDGQHSATKARLHFKTDENKDGGWSSHTSDPNQWLQVDFRSYATVARIATQGRHAHNEWVVNYKLNYSDDGVTFQTCRVPGTNISKVFAGNKDSDSVVTQDLNPPITARFLRILPTKWNNRISLRMELYGCAACFAPLGMENNAISDGQISASSQVDEDHAANQARLHAKISGSKGGGWSALKNDPNQWLQVDLGTYTRVTHVATQGRNSFSGWVTKYLLQYSDDGFIFRSYEEAANASAMIFVGNKDSDTVVYNILKPPITARFIRILPLEWHSQISLRIEIYGCPGCVKSLGMENQAISDAQVTASSQMDNTHSAREARLHSKSDGNQRGGWVALKNDLNQWLQVDLGTFTRVTRVATQGRDGYDQWVTKYRLQYSDDGDTFHSFKVITINSAKVFPGNQDNSTVVYNPLSPPVTTRFIRLIPVGWHSRISMRIEIYGCPGCTAALGMALRTITDAQIRASSKLDNTHSAAQARLHSKAVGSKFGAWSALENDHHPWLQIDFGSSTKITRLATQGRNGVNEWVTRYTLEFCEDGVNFHPYKAFQGNQDSDTVVYHTLIPPITARFIRLLPLKWHNHVSLRTEVYGCPGCVDPLGMDSGAITDAQISASSQWDNNHAASRARLHMRYQKRGSKRGAWSSRSNDLNQWLEINLGGYTTLTRVATQGRSDYDQWVTKYRLQYSDDGVIFQFYKEPHQTSAKVFLANKDRNTIAYNMLNPPITTRFIRIKPMEWRGHISMRMEIYGCPGCTTPLGMENGAIHDSRITASSSLDNKHTAMQARLHLTADSKTGGGWSALKDDFYQWLQIELGGYTTVTRVTTQGGNGRNEWVTHYRLKYSRAGNIFMYYKLRENSSAMVFEGNKDSNSVSTNRLSQPIRARYIRFIPIEWHNHISMRVEIYGCPGCIAPLGMENKQISDAQISASSLSDEDSSPSKARLHLKEDQNLPGEGGWSALKNDLHQWLQVDLGGYTTLTRVATQGRTGSNEWVTNYKLQYSDDGMNFQFYNEHGEKSAKDASVPLALKMMKSQMLISPRLHSWMTTIGQHWQDYS
ncbi:uncharacterized protein [Porites lutea]|uniref:uncharacterized protein isoform X2 n=1 Tax=Porites lutea TaxID=51062 RepID=UPI003CC503B6